MKNIFEFHILNRCKMPLIPTAFCQILCQTKKLAILISNVLKTFFDNLLKLQIHRLQKNKLFNDGIDTFLCLVIYGLIYKKNLF